MKVRSEIGPLEAVIIHRPGQEHRHTLPQNTSEWAEGESGQIEHNPDYLLFDDIVALDRIAGEHDRLRAILASRAGDENVIDFRQLLAEVAEESSSREAILDEALCLDGGLYEFSPDRIDRREIIDLPPQEFVNVLISGRHSKNGEVHRVFKWPLPNLIFTRDIAAVIGDTILLGSAKWSVRKREMLLARFVFFHHPRFAQTNNFDFPAKYPHLSIEGGDILIISDRIVCAGMSERTSKESIEVLLPLCFEEGFEVVYAIQLPEERSLMHLDTCFTRISEDECLVFPPLFIDSDTASSPVYRFDGEDSFEGKTPETRPLIECLGDDGAEMIAIHCGGDDPVMQVREQWTDGANAFAISPGKIITYARNRHTLLELADRGFRTVPTEEFLADPSPIKSDEKMAITLTASELSRGRGGPRCLTMPVSRAAV